MKKVLLSLILLLSFVSFSQNVNDYQYVVVPVKFNFLKENDQYNLNTTTKLLLQKYGFKSYLSTDELPKEIADSRCKALYATLEKDNAFLVTKIKVVLKDCQEKVLYETEYGTSRLKDFAPAYNEAVRIAFKSFEKLHYKYNDNNKNTADIVPVVKTVDVVADNPTALVSGNSEVFYFAQPVANGFQVVDNEPKVIMRLFNTSQRNVFIAMKGDQNGVLITKEGKWFFEHYQNAKLVSEPINLKF